MNTVLVSKEGKEKIRIYAISQGCTIRKNSGLYWNNIYEQGMDGSNHPEHKIEYVGSYGPKTAVRDSKKGIVCL